VCLASTDSFAAGCITACIDRGRLDPERNQILGRYLNDIYLVLPELEGESHEYFSELAVLAKMCLKKSM